MSKAIGRILKDLRKDKIVKNYSEKNRYINTKLYQELKSKHECQKCHKNFKILFIHHVIPHEYGGTNDRDNLLVLCHDCHKIIDKLCDEAYKNEKVIK